MKTEVGVVEAQKAWVFMYDFQEKLLEDVECEVVLDGEDVELKVL